jgi:hypothetical protein
MEIEARQPGFSKANPATSANQAYKHYLSATGEADKKGGFKVWLQKQKDSGNLQKALGAGAAAMGAIAATKAGPAPTEMVIPTSEAGNLKALDPKEEKPKFLGMPIPVAIGVGVLLVAGVITLAIVLTKKK